MIIFRGLFDIVKVLSNAARQELEDPEYIQAKLLELQLAHELGEISEDEYETGYQELSARLQVAQQLGRPDEDDEDLEEVDDETTTPHPGVPSDNDNNIV